MKDTNTKEIIVKLVNTSSSSQEVNIDLKEAKLLSNGTVETLTSANLNDVNSFAEPKKISPTEKGYKLKGHKAELNLPAYSVTILKLKMKE